jgi:hypothetical protein
MHKYLGAFIVGLADPTIVGGMLFPGSGHTFGGGDKTE